MIIDLYTEYIHNILTLCSIALDIDVCNILKTMFPSKSHQSKVGEYLLRMYTHSILVSLQIAKPATRHQDHSWLEMY